MATAGLATANLIYIHVCICIYSVNYIHVCIYIYVWNLYVYMHVCVYIIISLPLENLQTL